MTESSLSRYLLWITFAYALFCCIIHPNGALRTGYLADPDD